MKKPNTIRLVDSFFRNSEHEIINTSLLIMLSEKYDEVEYYGSKSSIENIQYLLDRTINVVPKNVRYHIHSVPNSGSLKRNIVSTFYNIKYTLSASKSTQILLNYNNFLSLHILNIISKLLNKNITICCHAELESLYLKDTKVRFGLAYRLINGFFRKTKISTNLLFLVFGTSILENIKKIIPEENFTRFRSLDHPYFSTNISTTNLDSSPILNVGLIGVMTKQKGIDNALSLARKIKSGNYRGKIILNALSKVTSHRDECEALNINIYNQGKDLLSRTEYVKAVSKMDYIYFPYKNDSYKLTASGAVFEAIFCEKPIIALENDYFRYLFNKHGEFGFLCSSISEIEEKLESIYEKEVDLSTYLLNIRHIKTKLNPQNMATEFKELIDKTI